MSYESKWLKQWDQKHIFEAEPVKAKKKVFVTFPYPYMNGPVHVGTAFTSVRVDIYARFKRMQGYNVLFPWAWHWTGQSIVGLSYRLKLGDQNARKALIELDEVPETEVEKFSNPEYLASYYTKVSRKVIQETGFSIDWRREFTTIDPAYQRFVEWQYIKLKNLGYVVQGTHPVVWCPNDKSPTGDHDRMEGEGVSPEDFTLVKFQLGEYYLVAATLRPETIYGATNIWVNQDEDYVEARVDGEPWIVSLKALNKISEQKHETKLVRAFKGSEILGKYAIAPLTGKALPVLPARFVDADLATGVVYSVPAHAPYDYMGLQDLKNGKMRASDEIIKIASEIQPIPVITLRGYSEVPARDIVTRYKISDSTDPNLSEATSHLYREEFHSGIMKKNTGPLSDMKVSDAKQKAVELIKKTGRYATMLELPERVVCRCGTRCYVKVLENQWFLNYSNKEWKEKTRKLIEKARILPEEAREWYYQTIEWLDDKPCARRSGMGTRLPWDKEWLVETLSDSTIYMAYYTISKFVNQGKVTQENLRPEVLDYIFLGEGRPESISKKYKIPFKVLKAMRDEFLYWYPVDLRNSAKELIPNHLTFFAFHHAALFDEKYWPRCISVNGMLQIEGQKMSKTRGIFITWKKALETYGPDSLRLALSLMADGMEDANWSAQKAKDAKEKVESILPFIISLKKKAQSKERTQVDDWLVSVMGKRIQAVTQAIEEMRIRKAATTVFLDVWNDIKWYLHRTNKPNKDVINKIIHAWVKLMSPFTPFIAEEINKKIGGKGLVCTSDWPAREEFKNNEKAELAEILLNRVLEDVRALLRVVKGKKEKISLYVSSKQLTKTFIEFVSGEIDKKTFARKVQSYGINAERAIKLKYELGDEIIGMILRNKDIDEMKVLSDASEFLSKELGIKVSVEEYDKSKTDKEALPFRPAIYIQ